MRRSSPDEEMAETDAERGADDAPLNYDTLTAADAELPKHIDEQLLRRDLKARMFGSEVEVRIGRYDVLDRIGRGGMGTVYLARDPELSRRVALKLLRADRSEQHARMLAEARSLAQLSHPNVVTVHEVGTHDDRVYLAMEFIEGHTLRAWLDAGPSRSEIFAMFAQAARGLHAAHEAGLVHRDFKADNVIIGDDGRVRVLDFGVAKPTGLAAQSSENDSLEDLPATMTQTGQLLGTPAYMAAEQFLGEAVDARTDVFAFCVALYEALEGRRPYAGDDPAALYRSVLAGDFRPMSRSHGPRALAALIERGLARDPSRRPASLEPFVTRLDEAAAPRRRRGWIAGVGAVMGACAVVGLVFAKQAAEAPGVEARAAAAQREADRAAREAEAFSAMLAVEDDEARAAAAEAFLDELGEDAHPARRAIAHSVAGDVAWRMSCPEPHLGLCVATQPVPDHEDLCSMPIRGVYTRVEREPQRVRRAREHLEAARALSGIERPQDDALAGRFDTAIARALVQLADEPLEAYLTHALPAALDFDDANALSTEAFATFHERHTRDGQRLLAGYKEVKGLDPTWGLVAGARSAQVYEAGGEVYAHVPPPATLEDAGRREYCKALRDRVLHPPRIAAFQTYQWCDAHAREHELTEHPLGEFCRKRYALFLADGSGAEAEIEAALE